MPSLSLPAIDAATLALVARRVVGDEALEVADWQIEPLAHAIINPVSGGLYRVAGTGWSGPQRRPWSAILKIVQLAAADQGGIFAASADPRHWNYWQREPLAYAGELLDTLAAGLAAPRCYYIMAPSPLVRWLWLEEISGSPAAAWPLERYGLAARHLGRWQGAYLAGRPLPAEPWLSRNWLRGRLEQSPPDLAPLVDAAWANPLVRRWFPRSLATRLPRIWAERGWLLDALERQPPTLCHFDLWPPNLFARRTAQDVEETVLLDWSYLGAGAAGLDAGNLVPDAATRWDVPPSDLTRLEAQVYPGYLAGLADAGWQGDERRVRLGFALGGGLIYSLFAGAWLGLALDPQRHAAAEQRSGRSIEDFLAQKSLLLEYALGLVDESYGLAHALENR